MAVRSSPSASGVNRLKSGRSSTGATNWMTSRNALTASQQTIQADGPPVSNSRNTPASSGPPSTTARSIPLRVSRTKVSGVVVFRPKRSSMPKVA